ncbi:MAG: cadherin-like beta sandwich domain-containing protein, partial [Clostridia bacterium]|nr:cadherin-like beta sandwich domain-containing protein [Clostridia bacterium]
MKRMSKILSFVIAVAVCLSILPFNTLAAGSASIAFSKQNPTVGDTVTVTVTVSATDMYGVNVSGSYNEEVLTYISGASSGGAGLFQIADSENFNGESSKSFTLTFKAKKAGTSSISIKGQVASGIPPADVDVSSSANFSVKDVTLSNNANLSSLRTSAGSLSPRFSQNVTEYTVNVKNSVTECKVYGTTADPNATIGIVGSATLKVGQNKRVLTVTAPSGAQKSYTLTIIRSEVEEPEETVSDTSSVSETSAALETIIDGVSYMVLQDISSVELPVGFNVTKRLYNNEEVSVAIDEKENYELFYLKSADSDIAVPYTFDDAKNLFKKVNIITQGSNSYIVAEIPEDLTVPDDFTAKTVKIQDISI